MINEFPGYEYVLDEKNNPHNMYRGTDVGFGGYVYAEPGMYQNVALLDVGNMHGASIIALNKFGEHTKNYEMIREARMAIKARDYDRVKDMFDGKLMPYLTSDEEAEKLQKALKLVLNSTYGIAAATFDNPLRDPRDKNNIIALRGALFMRTLQDEIVDRGFQVIHIKTDSVKVPNATPELIDFIIEFGRKYDYEFEHEATYERICLINNADYIAKYDEYGIRNKGGKAANQWTATGKRFSIPYIFKTLFSHEPIVFEDLCETKTVKTALYLDMNEDLDEDQHDYHFIGRVGLFSPVVPGCGGGLLLRQTSDGGFASATGAKGYRWMESEMVKALGKENDIDYEYYHKMVDDAIKELSTYGDYEWFMN